MPPTARTVQQVTRSGLNPVFSAVDNTNGESFPNGGNTWLHVKNGSGSPLTVTITQSGVAPADGATPPTITRTVPAGQDRLIGKFPPNTYNDANNNVVVGYSAGATITAAAFTLD